MNIMNTIFFDHNLSRSSSGSHHSRGYVLIAVRLCLYTLTLFGLLHIEAICLSAPQTVGLNFTGATLADSGFIPPDSMGAVGPAQFIVAINGRLRSFNKTTGAADGALNRTANDFFTPVRTPGYNTSDPRIRYDRFTQ